MVHLEQYNNDGANWQAQAVLAYLRTQAEDIEWTINNKAKMFGGLWVGRYENCREQGYVFHLACGVKIKNYAVYEHRNFDGICVLICEKNASCSLDTPSVDAMWADKAEEKGIDKVSKYDYDEGFKCGDILGCGEWIENDMRETLKKWIEEFEREGKISSEE